MKVIIRIPHLSDVRIHTYETETALVELGDRYGDVGEVVTTPEQAKRALGDDMHAALFFNSVADAAEFARSYEGHKYNQVRSALCDLIDDSEAKLSAIAYLSAEYDDEHDDYVYHAEETSEYLGVEESDLVRLGKLLATTPDAYSLWCSETTPRVVSQ